MGLFVKRTTSTEITVTDGKLEDEMTPSTGGKYRIEVSAPNENSMHWIVVDPAREAKDLSLSSRFRSIRGPGVIQDGWESFNFENPRTLEQAHRKALKAARAWVDQRVAIDTFKEQHDGAYVEWYGETPENSRKIIETQKSYIEELEAKLDEHRGPDGKLDPDKLG